VRSFLPHREQRIRSASSLSVIFQPIIPPLYARQRAHARMVRSHRARVCSVRDNVLNCTTSGRK
jgi:hypothetical protein